MPSKRATAKTVGCTIRTQADVVYRLMRCLRVNTHKNADNTCRQQTTDNRQQTTDNKTTWTRRQQDNKTTRQQTTVNSNRQQLPGTKVI